MSFVFMQSTVTLRPKLKALITITVRKLSDCQERTKPMRVTGYSFHLYKGYSWQNTMTQVAHAGRLGQVAHIIFTPTTYT